MIITELSSEFVHIERTRASVEIALARPAKKNALTADMYRSLAAAVSAADQDESVRALLIYGEGASFCAGNDLRDFVDEPPRDGNAPVFQFLRAVANLQKPLVVAVEGLAVGIGTTLLLHADLAVAASDAQFSLPFVKLGLVPEFASSLLLPQRIGHVRACQMLLLGEALSADSAAALGLVHKVVAVGESLGAARAAVDKMAQLPSEAVVATKRLLKPPVGDVIKRIDDEAAVFGQLLQGDAFRAAAAAFLAGKS